MADNVGTGTGLVLHDSRSLRLECHLCLKTSQDSDPHRAAHSQVLQDCKLRDQSDGKGDELVAVEIPSKTVEENANSGSCPTDTVETIMSTRVKETLGHSACGLNGIPEHP